MDFGIDIIEALKQRYGQGGDAINEEDMFIVSGKNKKKAVEMVGADSIQEKQRCLVDVMYSLFTSTRIVSIIIINHSISYLSINQSINHIHMSVLASQGKSPFTNWRHLIM